MPVVSQRNAIFMAVSYTHLDVYKRQDKLFENQQLFLTPIVRNGRKATVGYQPDVWKTGE